MDFGVKEVVFIVAQGVMVASVIVSNKAHISSLKETVKELKGWLEKVQEQVTELRIKAGE